jgi:A/G-specific adenine glycosylase
MKATFTQQLLKWHSTQNSRDMPWKGEKDPYRIWLSEIILQQTRVEQGRAYYERFVATFPTLVELANAADQQVFKLWEGLGYYSRCRNLLATARFIRDEYGGVFPDNYSSILALKGIGPYTAAAISSFAYNLPYAVVDGNVQRVLSRYFGINTPVDETAGRKLFDSLAQSLLPPGKAGIYNQAIMDFGATVCKPRGALCESCVQRKDCVAFASGTVEQLPVKAKSIAIKERWFTYYVVLQAQKVWVKQRTAKGIWQNLYEFILEEEPGPFTTRKTVPEWLSPHKTIVRTLKADSGAFRQQLSHQTIHARFIIVNLPDTFTTPAGFEQISVKKLGQLAFPVIIHQYLKTSPGWLNTLPKKQG